MAEYNEIVINDRFTYFNESGDPELYDTQRDIFYPCISGARGGRGSMVFDDFITGTKFYLKRDRILRNSDGEIIEMHCLNTEKLFYQRTIITEYEV